MIICPQCGKESTSEQYCDFCGFAFSDEERRENASNVVATPFEVGSQTKNSPANYEGSAREVPTSLWGAVKLCFRRGGARGRASRPEFWFWALFVFLTVVVPIVGVGSFCYFQLDRFGGKVADVLGFVGFIIMAAALVWGIVCVGPTFSVTARRFHDVGLPGLLPYLLLLSFALLAVLTAADIVGDEEVFAIVLFSFIAFLLLIGAVVALCPGTDGKNKYGPKPEKRSPNANNSK